MIQVPGYLIKKEIGVGGMATVYLAVQTSLEREVALKVMNPAMVADATFSKRFMQEARTLASLSHPNIVAVYDVGITPEKLHYFSMQHLPNGDFFQRIKDGVTDQEILRVFAGVARALGYAHQRGFVHRDVAPGNIMYDINNNPVLTDFGIARTVSKTSRITNAGVSVGTSHYMSPEQARGGDVDGRSDIYSMGAACFEALTGNPPYTGEDGFAIAYAHVFEPVPRLPANRTIWQTLIDKAMAKDPGQRFQNTDEFLLELARVEHELTGTHHADPLPRTSQHSTVVMPTPVNATTPMVPSNPDQVPLLDPLPQPKPRAQSGEQAVSESGSKRPWLMISLGMVALLVVAALGLWGLQKFTELPAPTNPDAPLISPLKPESKPKPKPEPSSGEQLDPTEAVPEDENTLAADDPAMALVLNATVVNPIEQNLWLAGNDLKGLRLSQPPGRNAIDRYKLVLKLDANNTRAIEGLQNVAKKFVELADKKLAEGNLSEFMAMGNLALDLADAYDPSGAIRTVVMRPRASLVSKSLDAGRTAEARWDEAAATKAYQQALAIDPTNADAQKGLKRAPTLGKPGFLFLDKANTVTGPELVVVSFGKKRAAVSRAEISVGEFKAFWASSGSRTRALRPSCRDREGGIFSSSKQRTWQSPGFAQSDQQPVVCVNFDDAKGFVDWLSQQTGKRYRLLTAQEWRTLAANSSDGSNCKANLADQSYAGEYRERDALACKDGFVHTAGVKRFEPGKLGLYDMVGNVREWVSDCDTKCDRRLAMGTGWVSTKDQLTPTMSTGFDADTGYNSVGFRVLREID
ncbi:bifunctional serine/threonine-protein kinase/formylglycine-generating enzyme family protein [Ahniella affigens]|uniref:bifunctional serine/threonine-protein kinase/formylglycine-generating enzyme family protein n=1 Tax=Ahniella affigens TaxID=2021234 RepID=UPI00147346F9|nr:bifunctional serine/threonine-protein kinase/formylglycine-generating enzyme family protein [Ahniella affigens]